jgi:hypothetical protein
MATLAPPTIGELSTQQLTLRQTFPSPDVTVIQLKGIFGALSIFNIYNDCNHSDTLKALDSFQQ